MTNHKFAGAGTIFIKDGKVLTVFRNNTLKNNNRHGLIGGRCEANETVKAAAIREAFEEVGVILKPEDLHLVHTIHSKEKNEEVLGFYFVAENWEGEPFNKDTSKHACIEWFPLDKLPEDLIPRNRQAIECWKKGIAYSEYGWE